MYRTMSLTFAILAATWAAFAHAEEASPLQLASAADADRVAREEEKLVLKALSKKIKFECDEMPFDEVILAIAKEIDCEVLINEKQLLDEGLASPRELNVTFKIGEMTARQTLHFLLEPYLLTWVANDGILEITTRTRADELLVSRVYDVHKLCKLLEPLTKEMFFQQRRGKQRPVPPGMMGGGGGGMFSVPAEIILTLAIGQFGAAQGQGAQPANRAEMAPMSVEAVLAAMLINCTSLKWLDRDGEGGSIQLGEGCLIVSQSYHGQFEIAGMLQSLERLVEHGAPGKSVAGRRIDYPVDEEAKIFETLAKPMPIDFEVNTLDHVLQQTVEPSGLPYWVDKKALSDEGIAVDSAVGLRRKMQKVPLGVCLKKILEPFGLTWVVDEGVLVITTQTRASEMLSVRFYDISRISKIANQRTDSGVVTVLSQSTHGHWEDIDGEGGNAWLVSSKHVAVLQTQQVHAEIALLIDDLTKDELIVPVQPALEIRIYTAPNVETARDLERVIPQLMETHWSPRGSIRQAGESLIVNQPANAHDRVEEIMDKLEQSNAAKKRPAAEQKAPEDTNESKADGGEKHGK